MIAVLHGESLFISHSDESYHMAHIFLGMNHYHFFCVIWPMSVL